MVGVEVTDRVEVGVMDIVGVGVTDIVGVEVTDIVGVVEGVTEGVAVTVGVTEDVVENVGVTEGVGVKVIEAVGVGVLEGILLPGGGGSTGFHQPGSSGSKPPVGTGSAELQPDPVHGGLLDPGASPDSKQPPLIKNPF